MSSTDGTPRPVPDDRLSAGKRRRTTKSGTALSQELIVRTAIRLLGQHGNEALTVRRLGTALGADPSAIYRYFRNADDLVLAVADELIGMSLRGLVLTGRWRTDIQSIGLDLHRTYVAHPQAAVLAASRVTRRPHEMKGVEAGLGVLRGAGFPAADAARHYHAFIDFTLGFAAIDAAAAALPPAVAAADRAAWEATYARLPADDFPHIAASVDTLALTMSTSAYPRALKLFLDGLAAALPTEGPE